MMCDSFILISPHNLSKGAWVVLLKSVRAGKYSLQRALCKHDVGITWSFCRVSNWAGLTLVPMYRAFYNVEDEHVH